MAKKATTAKKKSPAKKVEEKKPEAVVITKPCQIEVIKDKGRLKKGMTFDATAEIATILINKGLAKKK